jgi:hypothetical protein
MDMAACDPSLVSYQGFYYLYYSSAMTTAPNVFQTIIEAARSANIDGLYLTYTQRGTWESGPPGPQIIIYPMQIHHQPRVWSWANLSYRSEREAPDVVHRRFVVRRRPPNLQTFMLESTDPVTWTPDPSRATNLVNQASIDVKYDPSHAQFVMVKVENEFQSNAYLGFAVSSDGMHWNSPQTVIPPSEFPVYTHDAGMAGDETGNIVSPHTLVGFGAPYNLANVNNWGQWDLFQARPL